MLPQNEAVATVETGGSQVRTRAQYIVESLGVLMVVLGCGKQGKQESRQESGGVVRPATCSDAHAPKDQGVMMAPQQSPQVSKA
jgi:hypothetical protein